MVEHGMCNTRHKDFFDIFRIQRSSSLNGELLTAAVRRTFDRQQRELPADPDGLSREFAAVSEAPWRAFLRKLGDSDTPSSPDTVAEISRLPLPVTPSVRDYAPPPAYRIPLRA